MRLHVGNIRPILGIEQHIKMEVFHAIVLFQVSYAGWQRLSTVRMTEGVPRQEKEKASYMVTGIHALKEVRFYIHLQFCLISVDLVLLNECSEHDKTLVCL